MQLLLKYRFPLSPYDLNNLDAMLANLISNPKNASKIRSDYFSFLNSLTMIVKLYV